LAFKWLRKGISKDGVWLTQWGRGSIPISDWGKFGMRNPGNFLGKERWITQALATPSEILKQKTVEESEIKWKVAHFSAPFFTATQIR
jgi:hypothetical protein